ncbi:type I-F CRISPR-associated protein Csy1 [uncultured Marinobacter sp.]|uniref:type I-F CRISPR-associated protein Csy1 n=1 Tax=uncultured Marinobacter sp. TaxID=187379 RepID=UPI0030DB28BF
MDDPKRAALQEQFQYENWIGDAARRVRQIQLVTHSLKATHPDAKGSSLYAPPNSLGAKSLVGTHSLGASFHGDVVGNAAALDVYKFLRLQLNGKSLLDRVLERDEALMEALSDSRDQADEWVDAFASITEPGDVNSSHTRAKQIYFLVGDDPGNNDHFHLLAPLYATSLAHHVFLQINEDRFGDSSKAARKARYDEKAFEHGYFVYPELAIQKLGGTKPQNISQLNSERGGNNYLLASMPPNWTSRDITPPLKADSVFPRFGTRLEVRRVTRRLVQFLATDPAKTMDTRNHRDELLNDLCGELLQFAAELRTLPPGWSESGDCKLNEAEVLWLDPGRAEWDEAFRARWKAGDWPGEVRHRFANWLNSALSKVIAAGDPEHRHWSEELKNDGNWLKNLDTDRRWIEALDALEQELEE